MLNPLYQISPLSNLRVFKQIGLLGVGLVCLNAEDLNDHRLFPRQSMSSKILQSNIFHQFSKSSVRVPNDTYKQAFLDINSPPLVPNITGGISTHGTLPIYHLDSSSSSAFTEVETLITPPLQSITKPLDTTDIELLQILCQPEGPRNFSVSLKIPAYPIQVRSKATGKTFLYLGNGVKYTETEGITLADAQTETAEAEKQLAQELLSKNYEPSVNLTLSNMIVVQQKIVPRQYVKVERLYPKTPNGVDTDLLVKFDALQVFLESEFHVMGQLDDELKEWYYFVTIAMRGIGSSVPPHAAMYISLTRLPSRIFYIPLSGETMVILDIARVAAFCGMDGLHMFWKMIRCHAEIEAANVTHLSLSCRNEEELKFRALLNLCAVEDRSNLNRILFRRSHATFKDKIPGMVSMFSIPGSTIQNAVPPTLEQVLLTDE